LLDSETGRRKFVKGNARNIESAYELAGELYAAIGVDTASALKRLDEIPISIHCWQGDDVRGFENPDGDLTGGIQTSGNYPGRARNADELRADLEVVLAQVPGRKRLNLHAIYLESDTPVERDAIEPRHFEQWVKWAKANDLGLDFNPTCFSYPLSEKATLSHSDAAVRKFWIDHCIASRRISEYFGIELGTQAVMNIWIPDGDKDLPADRLGPRKRLMEALDEIVAASIGNHHKIAVEGKLFGIGSESYTAGSNDFYLAYAVTRKVLLCLDAGTFIRPKMWPTRFRRRSVIWTRFFFMFHVQCAGTLTTSSFLTMQRWQSRRRLCAQTRCHACTLAWTSSMRASTAWRPGSSVPETCARLCC
jgi:L-rhamnose isomerase